MARGMFNISLPAPGNLVQAAIDWFRHEALWWATSVTAHVLILAGVFLFVGTVAGPIVNEAPKFQSVKTEIPPPPPIENFEVGDTPIEPTELTTDSLTLAEAPQIAQD